MRAFLSLYFTQGLNTKDAFQEAKCKKGLDFYKNVDAEQRESNDGSKPP